ncbi:peptidase M64 [Carboxylicivirga sediminis]|uniref:Peptidase M64 n=1 Tax=Carboxylicivirga sediminis TaxID=2006564 RepID=A0A941J1B8_9BACT|nr:M64 family metallopeptidase [Carboxylicivirga sediminis]MBR8537762.1 peptidase M64 [Carboxylicivirga sediminis]
MKIIVISMFSIILLSACVHAQTAFDTYFSSKSMRIDLVLAGNKSAQSAYLLEIIEEPNWGGSQLNLIDELGYGEYRYIISEASGNQLIYSRGFCTLFEEWRTTEEAKFINKAFFQTVTFPYPKDKVIFKLEERRKDGTYNTLMTFEIDPEDPNIRKEALPEYKVVKVIDSGEPKHKVDFTFVAEGYQIDEMDKFIDDVKQMADYILEQEPYKSHRDKFNFWAVCSPSIDGGTDNPRKNKWVNTAVSSSFNTFYVDRYLETGDVRAIRNIAACAPYDHICVLVKSAKYGGGGIYNHFSIGTSDHPMAKEVMLHEIGHGFGGLADEYYTSDVAYQNFFDLKVEPWQPNITTLVNFKAKWQHLIKEDVPVPTPFEKQYTNETGVFEGGGYVEKGVYRPAVNCRMKTNEAEGFCAACQEAIVKMIEFVTD